MPKNIGFVERGRLDILTLFGVAFLVVSIGAGVLLTQQKQIFNPNAKSCVDEDCEIWEDINGDAHGQDSNEDTNYGDNFEEEDGGSAPPPVPEEDKPQTAVSGYSKDEIINTVADQNRAGYDCTKGGCAPGAGEVSGYYLADNGRYYAIGGTGNDPAAYEETSLKTVKEKEAAANQGLSLNQITGNTTGTNAFQTSESQLQQEQLNQELNRRLNNTQNAPQQEAVPQTTSTTSTSLEKTDEGFIRTTTTITRDATGKVVDSKSVSTTAKTTSTFTQRGADLIRTDTTVTTDLATGKVVDTAKSQTTLKNTVAQPTTSITVNQQGTVSIKQPAGSVCTFSSDCESGGCGIGEERGGITKTCQAKADVQPQTQVQAAVPQYSSNAECMAAESNNIYKCRGTASTQETFNTLNTLTFGGFGNYVGAYSPDKVDLAWRSAGYESAKACQDDLGAKYGPRGAQSCNTYEITKEQTTSSIALGTTLTVEGAALIAVPATLAAGSGGAALTTGFTALGGISTLSQTSNAVVAQIEDPGSAEAWKQTGFAALSWANLTTADYLLKAATPLARGLNTVVSGINLAVDVPNAITTCKETPGILSCGGAVAAVVADIGFGTLDIFQGQTIFRNVPKVDTPSPASVIDALTPPKLNVPDSRLPTPEELRLLETPSRATITNTAIGTEALVVPEEIRFGNSPEINAGDPLAMLSRTDDIETHLLTQLSDSAIQQEETLAQLLPQNPGGRIPDSPVQVDTPLAREPEVNTANNIADTQTNTVNVPTPPKQPVSVASLYDDYIVKPLDNLFFGKDPIILENLDTPLSPVARENSPIIAKPIETQQVNITYTKELDPALHVKNVFEKYGDTLTTAYKNKDSEALFNLARENGYEVKLVEMGSDVTIIENGRSTTAPLKADNSVRIGADGKTLYVAKHPNRPDTIFDFEDLIHDVGAILLGGKTSSKVAPDISLTAFENYLQEATGQKYSGEQIRQNIRDNIGTDITNSGSEVVPDTWLLDSMVKGRVPAKTFDNLIKPPTLLQKVKNVFVNDNGEWFPGITKLFKNDTPTPKITEPVPGVLKPNPEVPTKVGTKIPDADPNNTSFKERTEALKEQGLSQEEAANRLLEENNAVIDWVDKNTVPGDVVRDKEGIFLYIKDEGGTWRQLDRDGNIVSTAFGNYDLNGGEIVATGAHIENGKQIVYAPTESTIPAMATDSLTGTAKVWDQTKIIISTIPETGAGTNFIKTIAKLDDFWNKPQVEGNPSTARSVLFAKAQQQIKKEGFWNWITGPSTREAPGFTVEPPTTIPAEPLVKISPFADESASAIIPEGKTLPPGSIPGGEVPISNAQQAIDDTIAKGEVPVVYDLGGSKLTLDRRSIAPGIYLAQYDNGRGAVVKIPYDINAELALKGEYNLIYKLRDALTNAGREDLLIHIIEPISPASFGPDGATLDGYIMPILDGPTLREFPNGLTPQDIQDFRDMTKIWDDAGISFGDLYPTNIVKDRLTGKWVFFDPAPVELTGTTGVARKIELINGGLPAYIKDAGNITMHADQGFALYPVDLNNQKALENMYSALGITQPSTPPIEIQPTLIEKVRNRIFGEPPITPGSVFDPDAEITKILGPKGTSLIEQQSALIDFKAKLAYQQKGMAEIQTSLESTITKNPEVAFDELTSQVNILSQKYGLADWQKSKFDDALNIYEQRRVQISKVFNQYPSENNLFEAMFGRKPVGKVSIEKGPVSIHIKVYNFEDYTHIHSEGYLNLNSGVLLDKNLGKNTGGFFMPSGTLLADTEGIIVVENKTRLLGNIAEYFIGNSNILIHEDQHALNNLLINADIYPTKTNHAEYSNLYYNLLSAIESGDRKQTTSILQEILKSDKALADSQAMDEVLAYLKQGTPKKSIQEILSKTKSQGGLYDFYGWQNENFLKGLAPEGTIHEEFILKAVDDVFGPTAQKNTIDNALGGFDSLLSKGYTRDEAIAALEKVPLSDWKKFADRTTTPNIISRTASYITGKLITPRTIAMVRSPAGFLLGGGVAFDIYQIINTPENVWYFLGDWWQNLLFNEPESTTPSPISQSVPSKTSESTSPLVSQSSPAKTSEEILQENILGITNNMKATTPEELARLFASIGDKGAYVGSDGSLICGPLSLEILKKLGLYSGDVNLFYQLEPGTQWDRVLKAFPNDKFIITNTLEENRSVGDMKYWKDNPLKVGDFMFLEVKGGAFGYDHMLVVDMVDDQGRAYSTTNHFTIENGVTTWVMDRVLLYDPTNANNPDAMFNKWTDRSLLNVNGNTGSGGFLVVRPKPGTITVTKMTTKTDDSQVQSQNLFDGNATYAEDVDQNGIKYHTIFVDHTKAKFFVTPSQQRTTTSNFLSYYNQDIAINGDGFDRYSDTLAGYGASEGRSYGTENIEETLYIDKDNNISFTKPPQGELWNAISFPNKLVENGRVVPHPDKSDPNPRTALGITANGDIMLVTVDGVEYQTGVTADELSQFMVDHGAVTAVMFDSGSSTTMVVKGMDGNPEVLNNPNGGEQQVLNHLGISFQ